MITLGIRSDYSFLRGFGSPEQWRARADELSLPVLGLTDYISTWGHVQFVDAFKKSKTKLMLGVQLPVVTLLEKDPRHDLVTLLARTGRLSALYDAVGLAEEQMYYRPRLTWAQVQKLVEQGDVEAIVNQCSLGSLANMEMIKGLYVGARPIADNMLRIVKSGDFKIVPAHMPVIPRVEDRTTFALTQAVSEGHRMGELDGDILPLLRQQEFEGAMSSVGVTPPKAWWTNAAKIAKNCTIDGFPQATKINMKAWVSETLEAQVRRLAGLRNIDLAQPDYAKRLEHELGVIREKQFEDYFLFVGDLVRWAKDRMFIGPGRGSSSGSLVCYCLGITEVDPLAFGTLFERFIDITRPDWPDIDVDFPDNRRDEVYAYLKEKYGEDHVARLGTVSFFGGKSAINDTAKATGVEYNVARELGKVVEGYVKSGMQTLPLSKIFEVDPTAQKFVEAYPKLLLAADLEDHARHHGVHAAGVVVTNEPVQSFGSVDKHGTIALDMKMAEKIGMIKMDVLGLRTLSVIQDVCDQIGMNPADLYKLDWKDPKVFALFNNDRVTGVFQFEGQSVRQLMREVTVEKFDDLAALTSLARPGPLSGGAAGNWVKRRSGAVDWDFLHPSLSGILAPTFGTLVYQEQAMAIVRELGGFDEPNVNKFRRAVGKKDPATLKGFEDMFLKGCEGWQGRKKFTFIEKPGYTLMEAAPPISTEQATKLWDEMCEFGSYAFNLAHAVSYGMISYMAAYLKAYHPLEFAVANLRNAADDEQAKQLLREISDEGVAFVPFDPAKSRATWAIVEGVLYGGFDSVKGVGPKTARDLLAKREAGGENWLDTLTDSQRDRLTRGDNTPWHMLSYFGRKYYALYHEPASYRSATLPSGVTPPIFLIKDIPPAKGTYRFLGRIIRRTVKDANSPEKVAKRGGSRFVDNTSFVNLIFADDTGEIGSTINRFKVGKFAWLLDNPTEGRDYLVKGNVINDDSKWLFIDDLVELKEQEDVHVEDVPKDGTGDRPKDAKGDVRGPRRGNGDRKKRKSAGASSVPGPE